MTPRDGLSSLKMTPRHGLSSLKMTPRDGLSSLKMTPREGLSSLKMTPRDGLCSYNFEAHSDRESGSDCCPVDEIGSDSDYDGVQSSTIHCRMDGSSDEEDGSEEDAG